MSAFLNKRRRLFLASLACAAVLRSSAPAATTDALIEEAKREGEVVYYASMNLSEANALIGAFEKRYPFIKVKLNRTGSEKLLTRVLTEARAKKNFADVRSEEHTSELQSLAYLVCRLLLEKKNKRENTAQATLA